jgi:hypothetical protein
MDIDGLITIALVCVALWTFVPRHIRHALRSGLEPSIIVIAESVRVGTRYAWKVITHLAYQLLIGRTPNNNVIVNQEDATTNEDDSDFSPVSEPKLQSEIGEIPRRVAENDNESISLGENMAAARAVVSGKLGLTEAVKILTGAKSGEKYQKRTREVKALIEKMQNQYPRRTPEQEELRSALGIAKK